ncbi:MAG: ABC transporter permease [Phycisphaerae bacterium]|nr:ABC transporter permease [Gemmatimonadaceae bacterium]
MNRPKTWAPIAALSARVRSLGRSLTARTETERETREEFEHHISLRAAHLVNEGMPASTAEKQARMEFGHIESHRADARVARGLRRVDQLRVSWIDVKLGVRMLVKYPVLSIASVFALAVGIPIGLAPGHLANALNAPLPGDRDNRVRAIRYWDPATQGIAATSYGDFDVWSRSVSSFSSLAAFRAITLNVSSGPERAEPVASTQVTGSAFEILGVVPQLGRTLNATDASRGAPDVAVIGHRLWVSRFNSDARIIGRNIRIGGTLTTVVGVMPDAFRFPSNEQLWIPLRDEFAGSLESGISVQILGRLADDVSPERAQAELQNIRMPLAGDAAGITRQHRVRAEVVPFGLLSMGLPRGGLAALPEFRLVQVLMFALVLVACGNVAMLVFARTATRFREIAIRTALGASRSRIVSQIFAETFILSALSAALGVFTVDWLLRHVNVASIAGLSAMPYWLTLNVTGATIVNAVVLATVCATVAGVFPAIRITGRAINQNIRAFSGVRFGKLTGALVVADIAVAVIAVGLSLTIVQQMLNLRARQTAGIPAAEYLAVEIRMSDDARANYRDDDRAELTARRATAQRALVTALAAEPGVTSVTVADVLPLMEHRSQPVEVEGVSDSTSVSPKWVRSASVDVDYFRALGQTMIAGREFTRTDAESAHGTIIVNVPFVNRVLGGKNPIGVRVRFPRNRSRAGNASLAASTYEIVGVVPHLGVNMVNAEHGEAVYFPVSPGQLNPIQVALHVSASPMSMLPRVREIASAIDPDLAVSRPAVLGELRQSDWYLTLGIGGALTLLAIVLVALATSGLFAMLSLSVSERTREIGIRAALGATRQVLVLTILRKSLVQIGIGALIGFPVATYLNVAVAVESDASPFKAFLVATALSTGIVVVVSVLSCLVPTRRVLAVQATEAMRAEA